MIFLYYLYKHPEFGKPVCIKLSRLRAAHIDTRAAKATRIVSRVTTRGFAAHAWTRDYKLSNHRERMVSGVFVLFRSHTRATAHAIAVLFNSRVRRHLN